MVLLLFKCLGKMTALGELEQCLYQMSKCIQVELLLMGKPLALLWLRGHRLDTRSGTIRAVVRVQIIITTAAAVAAGMIRAVVA